MKVRDGHAVINGDKTMHTMPSGSLVVVADDGSPLFSIKQDKHGVIKHESMLLDDRLLIEPVASNMVRVTRPEYPSR